MFGKYTKAILGGLAALATWGVTAGADGTYSQVEFWGLLGVVVAALTVAGAANATKALGDGGFIILARDRGVHRVIDRMRDRDSGSAELWIIAGCAVVIALVLVFGRP